MSQSFVNWQTKTTRSWMRPNEVHIWRAELMSARDCIEKLIGILSQEELARANKMFFEKDRIRFIISHAMLRTLLASYLGTNPDNLIFAVNSHGKPSLKTNSESETLQFNMSHSGDVALLAFAHNRSVGVDIERLRADLNMESIARTFFSSQEIQTLDHTTEEMRLEIFFQYWTRKEAFLKGIGEGLFFPMEQCNSSTIKANELSKYAIQVEGYQDWYGKDILAFDGYASAVAVAGNDSVLSYWNYSLHQLIDHDLAAIKNL